MNQKLKCLECGITVPDSGVLCSHCRDVYSMVAVTYGTGKAASVSGMYRNFLPFGLFSETDFTDCPVTETGKNLWVKNEGDNPSGSIKEKDLKTGLTCAGHLGFKQAVCVSGGSGIKAVAYLSNNPIPVTLYSPHSTHVRVKNQILLGAQYEDTFRLAALDRSPGRYNITPGINPYSQEGCKVISWQIIKAGYGFDIIVIPSGNGSSLWGVFKGFKEAKEAGLVKNIPRIFAAELKNGPLSRSLKKGTKKANKKILSSAATSIDVLESFSIGKALIAVNESGGGSVTVSEAEIESAYRSLHHEGLKPSHTAAAGYAAAIRLKQNNPGKRICCILTARE